jgi:hypothetical protein
MSVFMWVIEEIQRCCVKESLQFYSAYRSSNKSCNIGYLEKKKTTGLASWFDLNFKGPLM